MVNKVFHLDANRAELDVYNVGWKAYLEQRETDERRRKRGAGERREAGRRPQGRRPTGCASKATKAKAAQNMDRRAERLLSGLDETRRSDRVAKLRFPDPAPCGTTPLTATGLSKSYGSLEVFTDVDLAVDRGSRVVVLGLNGAGKTTLLRMLAEWSPPDTGEVEPGHGLRLGYYAAGARDARHRAHGPGEHAQRRARTWPRSSTRTSSARSSSPATTSTSRPRVLSGGEKTRLALATLVVSSANVLLLDEPTNNLDPASRAGGARRAAHRTAGAVVLVTHDEGAVEALQPERVVLLPDGVEDLWNRGLRRPGRPGLTRGYGVSPRRRRTAATGRGPP